MKHIHKYIIIIMLLISHILVAQIRPNSKRDQEAIRQYGFSIFSVADAKSDSIRILAFLSVPNHVLQFLRKTDGFEAQFGRNDIISWNNFKLNLMNGKYLF